MKITIIKKIYGLFSDTAQPLTTHYGAIKGFIALGPQTIENYLLPNLTIYYQLLASELNNSLNPVKRGEAEHCRDALFVNIVFFSQSIFKLFFFKKRKQQEFIYLHQLKENLNFLGVGNFFKN